MAVTRKLLKGMGLTEEQVDTIIEAHTETVTGLQADINRYKAEAEKLPGVQKQLSDLEAAKDGGYKEKYEKEHKDFEDFKTAQSAKETRTAKETAYRAVLTGIGLKGKKLQDTILASVDFESVKLGKDGKITDAASLEATLKADWADYIDTESKGGAHVDNPPGGGGGKKSRKEILDIKDPAERQKAIAENMDVFLKGE